jgi:hypothetical protein
LNWSVDDATDPADVSLPPIEAGTEVLKVTVPVEPPADLLAGAAELP